MYVHLHIDTHDLVFAKDLSKQVHMSCCCGPAFEDAADKSFSGVLVNSENSTSVPNPPSTRWLGLDFLMFEKVIRGP